MPVYKRKIKNKTKYYVKLHYTVDNVQMQTNSKYFNTKQEAIHEELRMKVELNKTDTRSMTFNEAFIRYKEYQKDKVKTLTYERYDATYKHIEPYLGNIEINKLTIDDYQKFKDAMNKTKLKTTSKNRFHVFLKALVAYTDKMFDINTKVFDKVGQFSDPGEIKKEMQFYTPQEFNEFISFFENDVVYKAFFKFLYFMGTRVGEANALRWVDIIDGKVNIKATTTSNVKGKLYNISSPKTPNSYRILPLSPHVKDDIKELYNYYKDFYDFNDEWFVFGGARPMSESTYTYKKNAACQSLGLKNIRIHDFRHSCASYYINKGASPFLVSKLLGHSNIKITMNTYSHLFPDDLDKLMNL